MGLFLCSVPLGYPWVEWAIFSVTKGLDYLSIAGSIIFLYWQPLPIYLRVFIYLYLQYDFLLIPLILHGGRVRLLVIYNLCRHKKITL